MARFYPTQIISLILLSIILPCQSAELGEKSVSNSKPYSNSGWTSLYNGKDLNNWTLSIRNKDPIEAAKVFSVGENNTVHVFKDHPNKLELNTGNSYTHGMMWTKRKYSKYIFRFEYKWGKKIMNNFKMFQYDAGMYYHVQQDKIWPQGIEYQIRYNHLKNKNHTGDYWASKVKLQWYSKDGVHFTAPWLGGVKQPIKNGEHLASENLSFHALNDKWNMCEVIVMADQYSIHKLNGQIVNYATDFEQTEGIIGLQSETAEIFYRNIEIKEFDEIVPVEHFL